MAQAAGRRGAPRPLHDELARTRLIDRLDRRWEIPVTTIVGPPGFGKSTVMAQAMRSNQVRPRGIDLWIGCEPRDADSVVLAGAIGAALDIDPADPTVDELADAIRARSPMQVALFIDDVHHLPDASAGAELLDGLVRRLPANGHVVLSSRTEPPIALARLRGQGAIEEIDQTDLAFTADETAIVSHTVPVEHAGGWPALVRLGAVAERPGLMEEFVWEEVLPEMSEATLASLLTTVIAGTSDAQFNVEVTGLAEPLESLLRNVPLLSWSDDDTVTADELWALILDRRLSLRETAELRARMTASLLGRGEWERAFDVAVRSEDWPSVRRAILMAASRRSDLTFGPVAATWVERMPPEELHTPEGRLLVGIACGARDHSDALAVEAIDEALAGFADRGDARAEAIAMGTRLSMAWIARDLEELTRLHERAVLLEDAGEPGLTGMINILAVASADVDGDVEAALTAIESIPAGFGSTGLQLVVERWRASLLILAGRADEAVESARRLQRIGSGGFYRNVIPVTEWFAGDPTRTIAGRRDAASPARPERERDDFQNRIYGTVLGASLGRATHPPTAAAAADGRDETLAAVCRAAAAIEAGAESDAAREIEELLAMYPAGRDGRATGELRRFLPYPYVLSGECRKYFDTAELGPSHVRSRSVARALLAARSGDRVMWDELPETPAIVTMLPLTWTVELAAHAAAARHPRGPEIVHWLVDEADAPVHARLRALEEGGRAEKGARALLADIPERPPFRLQLDLMGPPELRRDGSLLGADEWRSTRVRELLALLLLEGPTTRDRITDRLWPDKDPDAARNNLRITLSKTRRLLEPERRGGEPSFVLRQIGDHISLAGPPTLDSDIWRFRRQLEAGNEADARGDVSTARQAFQECARLVRGDMLTDATDWGDVFREQTIVEAQHATVRAGELVLADGDHQEATRLGERALELSRYDERAHRLIAASRLEAGDRVGARRAIERCHAMLDELGVPPAPETEMLDHLIASR